MDILNPASIVKRREALHLSRDELAEKAGVAATTLWRIEEGKVGGTMETWRSLLGALSELEGVA